MLLFKIKNKKTHTTINNIYLETLIKTYPRIWQKAWTESMQINENTIKENDIVEVLFNIIEHFCNILEDRYKITISFEQHIDVPYNIVDWNVVLHHVQVGKAFLTKKY